MSPATAQDSRPGQPGPSPVLPKAPPRLPPAPAAPESRPDEPIDDAHVIGMVTARTLGAVRLDVLRSLTPGVAGQTLALRARVTDPGPPARLQEAVVDATDVPALKAAVVQLAKVAETRNRGEDAQTTPTWYRFGSLGIGVVLRAERQSFYVSAGDTTRARITLTLEELNQIGTLVGRAEDKIRELERANKKRMKIPG